MGQALAKTEREGRARFDTIRLWDSYKELAILWRALTLIQMPVSAFALILAFYFFVTAEVIVDVPHRPDPGRYSVNQLPDSEFISVAIQFINLIYTYQPYTARKQFLNGARRYLWEPALTRFQKDHAKAELQAIEELSRTQIFYINTRQMRLVRTGEHVVLYLPGTRHRLVGDTPLEPENYAWWLKMKSIPQSLGNEYNIAIVDLRLERLGEKKEIEFGQGSNEDFVRENTKAVLQKAEQDAAQRTAEQEKQAKQPKETERQPSSVEKLLQPVEVSRGTGR